MKNKQIFLETNSNLILHNLCNLSQLVFEVTDACNLNCSYCAYSDLYQGRDARANHFMTFLQAKKVIDYLINLWGNFSSKVFPKRLNIGFYGGEPLLNFDLIKKIVEYINNKGDIGRSISYSMTTNGLLLDKYIDFLIVNNFSLVISLDGDYYSQGYRVDKLGKNSFDKVYSVSKYIQNNYPDYFGIKVNFNAVLHSKNSFDSLHIFFTNNFSKVPMISPLSNSNVNKSNIGLFNNICNDYNENFINSQYKNIIEERNFLASPRIYTMYRLFERKSGNVYYDFNDLLYNKEEIGVIPTGTCLPFAKKMFVTVNGKILQCEKISHKYYLGKIEHDDISLDLEKISKKFNKYIYRFIYQCKTCALSSQCARCVYRLDDVHNEEQCMAYINRINDKELSLDIFRNRPDLFKKIIYETKITR